MVCLHTAGQMLLIPGLPLLQEKTWSANCLELSNMATHKCAAVSWYIELYSYGVTGRDLHWQSRIEINIIPSHIPIVSLHSKYRISELQLRAGL